MKKISGCLLVVLTCLALASCGDHQKSNDKPRASSTSATSTSKNLIRIDSSTPSTPPSSSTTPSSTTTASVPPISASPAVNWSADKSTGLADYMGQFSTMMSQSYSGFAPGFNGNFYGVQVPDDIVANHTMNFAVDEKNATVAWSFDGTGTANYNVVACYSDCDASDTIQAHLYLFAFHNGQPVALVTMQSQGNNENTLYFSETQNTDLKDNFNWIAQDGAAQENGNAVATSTENKIPTFDEAVEKLQAIESIEGYVLTDYGEYDNENGRYRVICINSKAMQDEGAYGLMGYRRFYADGTVSELSYIQ